MKGLHPTNHLVLVAIYENYAERPQIRHSFLSAHLLKMTNVQP